MRVDDVLVSRVARSFIRLCVNLCGVTILKLENSGGIVVGSKKHWSPGVEVAVQSVERIESGGWLVFGVLGSRPIDLTVFA